MAQARGGGGLKIVAHGKQKYFGGIGRCLSGVDKVIPLLCQSKVELPSGYHTAFRKSHSLDSYSVSNTARVAEL